MMASLLRLDRHDVRTACDGPAALEAVRSWQPEVVLLDIGLPGMDGYELASRMSRMAQTRGALLVAITGYGREVDRRRGREAGFHHYLVKPLNPGVLEGVLAGTGPPPLPVV
jgi:CheY-like chemotaxis protein